MQDSVSYEITRHDGKLDDCGVCTLKIFQDGQIVQEIENIDCPEVESNESENECELSPEDTEKKQVRTAPLGFLRVSNTAFNRDGSQAADIPPECLAVYTVNPYIPIGGALNSEPSAGQLLGFEGQYCSDPGCDPPEIIHNFDECPCETCPQGTCPIECGDNICCYNSAGISVQAIAKSNYCQE